MTERPPLKQLAAVWLKVSLQSFGGGVATLALIRREFVDKGGWLTEADFLRDWSLCQLAPGINLVALVILIGRRTAGALGILIALTALLLPAFVITVALTAAYAAVIHSPWVTSALKGVIPAVAGIGLATALGMGAPIAKRLWQRGRIELAGYVALLAACIVVTVLWHVSTAFVLLGAGLFGAVFNTALVRMREAGA